MTAGKKLENLSEAIIEDILATPDDEIVAGTSKEEIESVRAALARAEQKAGTLVLAAARSGMETWKARRAIPESDRAARKARFEKFRAGDIEFEKKATLAARNGERPTEADLEGMADDYAELRRIGGK